MCQSQFEALIYQLDKNIKEKPSIYNIENAYKQQQVTGIRYRN